MSTALVAPSASTLLVYGASLVVVMWAVFDAGRRPPHELPSRAKAAWIIGSTVGWLFFGIVGAAVAVVYLVGPRRRMNAERW
jgi:hypothetical protein